MSAIQRPIQIIVRLIACAALTAACTGGGPPEAAPSPTETTPVVDQSDPDDEGDADASDDQALAAGGSASADDPDSSATQDDATRAASGTQSGPAAPEPDASESGSDAPAAEPFDPYKSEVPVTADLTPTCTVPGGQFTIEIHTQPELLVTYHAIYEGEEGGAHEPFGEGHGGNNAGYADANGDYTDSWVVSADAPVGEGRVEVFAADGDKIGYIPVVFEIADPLAGGCP